MSLNINDFFPTAWFKYQGEPFEVWAFDTTMCYVTGRFEDHSFRQLSIESVEPILIFDSILPAFGLEQKTYKNTWYFKHYVFVKGFKYGYDTIIGNIVYIHELQRLMITLKQKAVLFDSDIRPHVRQCPDF